MSEQEHRDILERYLQAFGRLATIDDLLHDDYVEEHPQSGERIRGKHNSRVVGENYPGGLPNMVDYSIKVSEDLGVGEMLFEYDGNRV
jgi:hypothetical protein